MVLGTLYNPKIWSYGWSIGMNDGFYPLVAISLIQKAESIGYTIFVQSKRVKMDDGLCLHSVSFIQEFIISKRII